MSDRMTLDHIDTLTADNRDLTTRIVGLEAERDHHRVGLVRVRAEADAATARAAELEAALLALVEAMPKCHVCYGTGTMPIRCTMCHDSTWDHECNDRNVPCTACSSSAAPLRAALLLLAKGGR